MIPLLQLVYNESTTSKLTGNFGYLCNVRRQSNCDSQTAVRCFSRGNVSLFLKLQNTHMHCFSHLNRTSGGYAEQKEMDSHVRCVGLQAADDHADGGGQEVRDVPQHHAWRPGSRQDVVHEAQESFCGTERDTHLLAGHDSTSHLDSCTVSGIHEMEPAASFRVEPQNVNFLSTRLPSA